MLKFLAPATTANLGPGFDALGLALGLYNELELETCETPGVTIDIEGEGADQLPRDEAHLVARTLRQRFQQAGEQLCSGLKLRMVNRLPLARGLGSSAAALVAALSAAGQLMNLAHQDVVTEASLIEGHPDNVAPCVLGGLVASVDQQTKILSRRLPIHDCWQVAVAIPDLHLSTEEARRRLPETVPFKDAAFNLSRVALLISGLAEGDHEAVREATNDRLHQPYRACLIPGFIEVKRQALQAGAAGAFLSGAGPTMAALVDRRRASCQQVAEQMATAFAGAGMKARGLALEIDLQGVRQA